MPCVETRMRMNLTQNSETIIARRPRGLCNCFLRCVHSPVAVLCVWDDCLHEKCVLADGPSAPKNHTFMAPVPNPIQSKSLQCLLGQRDQRLEDPKASLQRRDRQRAETVNGGVIGIVEHFSGSHSSRRSNEVATDHLQHISYHFRTNG